MYTLFVRKVRSDTTLYFHNLIFYNDFGKCTMVSIFHLCSVLGKLYTYNTAGYRWTNVTRERERNVLFNDALNTFYLRLYGVRHMVKDHSDSEKGNPLPPTNVAC